MGDVKPVLVRILRIPFEEILRRLTGVYWEYVDGTADLECPGEVGLCRAGDVVAEVCISDSTCTPGLEIKFMNKDHCGYTLPNVE